MQTVSWFHKKEKEKRELSKEERAQKKAEAERLALYAAFSASTRSQPSSGIGGGKVSGFDISTQQKIAAYNLLINDKE